MTQEQLSQAISMDQALIHCQHELKRIDSVNTLFCNGRKADRSIYDETVSTMVLHVESSNGKKISIDLPKDSSIGHELITTLDNFYRERKERIEKEFDNFMNGGAGMNESTCICCGDQVPEGMQVCPKCEGGRE